MTTKGRADRDDLAAVPQGIQAASAGGSGAVHRRATWRWRLRRWGLLTVDVLLIAGGLVLASIARYDGDVTRIDLSGLVWAAGIAVSVYPLVSAALRLHQGRHPVGSADELTAMGLAVTAALVTVVVADVTAGAPSMVPRSVPLIAAPMAFVFMLAIRLTVRRLRELSVRPQQGRRTLVFGAGDAGHQLVRSMLGRPDSPFLPVALLDDDPKKRYAQIGKVRMLGGRRDIADVARATRAEILVIALPSAESALVRELSRLAIAAGLSVKVLPGLADLAGNGVGIRDVRDIDIADLLGRRQIDTNVDAIAGYLTGKRVLVTGAGGSIGSELCRQISKYEPAELIMLDRDESALHAVQLGIHGEARLDLPDVVLADIRDSETLLTIFEARRPEVVFHAAALKHVTMLEQYPDEGWKTNVLGTRNVLEAATAVGVGHFINVSTDKAADPVNVLGRTKRTAEQLTATYAQRNAGAFLSVRFGNVLGSRGSVLTTFAAQIARGGPLTVTDPEVTRFFMTIPEAVQLVIQAGAIGRDGEALVLDMGEPVRIVEVARQLVALSGQDVEIVFTGLRSGEKLHEELFGVGEQASRDAHPLISHVPVAPLDEWALHRLGRRGSDIWSVSTTRESTEWLGQAVAR
ncbi:polysaccharide biosynthesis protein [Blastococcus capsensis]|uniref:polysaccharide biosynthesis protein n=1 Tax=Blastococcus capsensis TaxID=1564163 RepID=UPI002541068B|nr:nucleoside-diphosphate sugar epimerase/dehydratase [Blastococcus capsensis]MDK3257139.1 nucleoside-diphosphate sugar epimerase/dehydratase [Blastococcus capsensis]